MTDDAPAQAPSHHRGASSRGAVAAILGVATVLLLMVSTVAVWANATVFNSSRVATIVSDALAEPEVEAALADFLSDQIFTAVDVDAAVDELLPDQLQRLGPVIAAGTQAAVDRAVTRLLSNPDVQDLITELVERTHRRAMQLLEGDGLVDGITVVDGEVTVNLLPLISRGLVRLQDLGLLQQLDVPTLTAEGDPTDQIAQLEAATGRDLPPDFGQLVVYQSDRLSDSQASLQSAQQTFALAKRAVWVLVGLTILTLAATLVVARNRWRAALWLGLGGLAGFVITRAAVHRVVDEAPGLAVSSGGRAAISSVLGGATTSLLRLTGLLLIVAAGAALMALFRRQWRRSDLVAVGAVVSFVGIVAVLGLTLLSLLLGVAVALLVPVVAARFA
jgi:hypothetical protein